MKHYIEIYTVVVIYRDLLNNGKFCSYTKTFIDDLDNFNLYLSAFVDAYCRKVKDLISISTYHSTVLCDNNEVCND